MKYIFYLFFALWPLVSPAQRGHYFLSHYTPGDESTDHVSFDMTQDEKGVLYFATRAGILQFDGRNWEMINGNGAIYAVEINEEGTIFWAGANGFGILTETADGNKTLEVLSQPDKKDFYRIAIVNAQTCFLNDEGIFIYEKKKPVTAISFNRLSGSLSYLFELYGTLYVSTEQEGVFKLDKQELRHTSFNVQENLEIVFASRSENNIYLLGTSDNRLFLCSQGLTLHEIVLPDNQYINASVIINGSWISDQLIALGTLRGGVVFINPQSNRIEEIINYNTGLPDNEVLALMADQNKNLWVAHEYGFTRIVPSLPFRSFSHYDGLKGNLLCATSFDNEVYVGTSLGLYKLTREEVYDEIVYYVDVNVKQEVKQTSDRLSNKKEPEVNESTIKPPDTSPETVKKKRGLLGFLKRNRKANGENEVDPEPKMAAEEKGETPVQKEPAHETYITHRLKKTEKILRSSQFVYKKVNGIDAKVTHLIEVDGKLIAAGLAGAFQIDGLESTVILEEPVRFMCPTNSNLVLASTYSDNVRAFRNTGGKWTRTHLLENLQDEISYIFEGSANELWMCALDKIYRIEIENDQVSKINSVDLVNPNFSKTLGMRWSEDVLLANSNGFYRFDHNNNSIVRVDTLPSPKTYFASTGNLWYHDEHSWNVLGQFNSHANIHLLNICNDIRFISSNDRADDIWVITGTNELYKFFSQRLTVNVVQYPLYVKSVTQGDKKIPFHRRSKVDQEEGLLTFEVIQPNYTGTASTEYRYYLKGINDATWSEWSWANNRISFPYLPPGNYTLLVEARNIFGLVSGMTPLNFQVQPPFWKSSWFYAMEFTVFALLVMLSFKLSIRYRIISRLLSLLTIILLIEFIQTVAGYTFATNSSPVIDFIIQVIVAIVILPVEGFLRNLMFKSMGSGSRLYEVISEMDRREKGKSKSL